jgi:uncharacterized heparinase superfamily protein
MNLLLMIARGLRKPPRIVAQRVLAECRTEADRYFAAARARRFGLGALLEATQAVDLETLWQRLAARPFPAHTASVDPSAYERLCPGDSQRILAAAERASARQIDLLGTGPIELAHPVDWHIDYKSGIRWPNAYAPRMSYVNAADASDVKIPWEISRLHWLMPCGQAYLLTGAERYASTVRDILEEWIAANPYAHSVNWACTMEAALRILSWTWFFHVFARSASWADAGFRTRFLTMLYLHGDYTERHLEWSDLNGNHFTADAAGLVFAGLFFGTSSAPRRWQEQGWRYLTVELPRQVSVDGVDFEGSIAYHRLVLELFLLPALYRRAHGLEVAAAYRDRLFAMARFTQAYCRPDGSVPLLGDADDARALPLGGQKLNDHRYLPIVVGFAWEEPELRAGADSRTEAFWLLGSAACTSHQGELAPRSSAFPDGGYYIMRNERDHVFIDCAPIGTGGRGGHGHNDCLSFEASLDGVHLITDCGAYVYTASFAERNRFRSTAYHNTPRIDDAEINRFVREDFLWLLHNDARPEVRRWQPGAASDVFEGAHTGYRRLTPAVTPVRTLTLDHERHSLFVRDAFEGEGEHRFEVPLHLAPGVSARIISPGVLSLHSGARIFTLAWGPPDAWALAIEAARVSRSYGVVEPTQRLVWRRTGPTGIALLLHIVLGEVVPELQGSGRPV